MTHAPLQIQALHEPDITIAPTAINAPTLLDVDIPLAPATPIATMAMMSSPLHYGGGNTDTTTMPVPESPETSIPPLQSTTLSDEQFSELRRQGFPIGLASELGRIRATYPIRFWVLDNSGSMHSPDGHRLRGSKDRISVVSCDRWTELRGAVEYHAQLAGLLRCKTVFRFLNDPGARVAPQAFTIAHELNETGLQNDVEEARMILRKCEPKGVTPLTEHLHAIRRSIQAVEGTLRARGQQAVVVLATDGLPSNRFGRVTDQAKNEFTDALRSLQTLPVWIVVRLCTDDEDVVEYYGDLDRMLEMPLEVIDDFLGEAGEIHGTNKWLNYALPLHRCREMGYTHRVLDLLDERSLNKDELLAFLELLLGRDQLDALPDIHAQWSEFVRALSKVVKSEGKQWNPNTGKLEYWIDMKELKRAYGNNKRFRLFG